MIQKVEKERLEKEIDYLTQLLEFPKVNLTNYLNAHYTSISISAVITLAIFSIAVNLEYPYNDILLIILFVFFSIFMYFLNKNFKKDFNEYKNEIQEKFVLISRKYHQLGINTLEIDGDLKEIRKEIRNLKTERKGVRQRHQY